MENSFKKIFSQKERCSFKVTECQLLLLVSNLIAKQEMLFFLFCSSSHRVGLPTAPLESLSYFNGKPTFLLGNEVLL